MNEGKHIKTNSILDNETGLVLVNYKEPLRKAVHGYGYQGALLCTPDGSKLQCHICGGLYGELFKHFNQKHSISKAEYTEKFDLARETALISEQVRIERQERQIQYMASLTDEQKIERKKRALAAYRKWRRNNTPSTSFKIRLETKNKRGTCPDQLLDKIKTVAKELGHTPSKDEFIDACESQRFVHLIYTTFGSYKKAVQMAELPERSIKTTKGKKVRRYSNEELLELLQIFYQENGRIPTETDCKRGLIPGSDSYRKRWGSFPKARELAGLPS